MLDTYCHFVCQHSVISQQREEEEKRESQRDQKFGRKRQFTSQHHDESGAGARMDHQQPARTRRRRDFLGYYKALGINLEESSECFPTLGI